VRENLEDDVSSAIGAEKCDEVMRLKESRLMNIKDKKKREQVMNALDIVGVDVTGKIESGKS
jgi:hypothetical protein